MSFLIAFTILLAASNAYSQSNEDLLALVRANAVDGYLEQASWTLPKSFHESGLAPSDKQALIEKWAKASAGCLTDALEAYEKTTETPLSEMVNDDGSFSLKGGGASADFHVFLESCIQQAWADIGARLRK